MARVSVIDVTRGQINILERIRASSTLLDRNNRVCAQGGDEWWERLADITESPPEYLKERFDGSRIWICNKKDYSNLLFKATGGKIATILFLTGCKSRDSGKITEVR